MKNKFIIYLSIFLSIGWIMGHRLFSHNPAELKTVGKTIPMSFDRHYRSYLIPTNIGGGIVPLFPRVFAESASRSAPLIIPGTTTTIVSTTTTTKFLAPKNIAFVSSSGCMYHAMSISQAHSCWDGLIDQYSWNHYEAFNILYCESTGKSNAINGRYIGLMQEDGGSTDPATNIHDAYYGYYLGGNNHGVPRYWSPWSCR